jgi:hypothetical protein
MYVQEEDRTDFLFSGKSWNVDLEVANAWKMLGADLKKRNDNGGGVIIRT